MSKTHTISNKLGHITGRVHGNVVQYRGIPYARIPGRFMDPVGPLDVLGDFDATKWGPMAVQVPESETINCKALNLPFSLMPVHRKAMSELDCANLVIVTPFDEHHEGREQGRLSSTNTLLPTIVWVHGGSNKFGSANFPAYDMRNFVAHSIEVGKPVVVVSLNHRLGVLGYLASDDIAATGNFGLKDQIVGLKWVQHHIEEFGGDPKNVTFMGESAGAIAGSLHFYSPTPLFRRAILFSGTAGFYPPRPISAHEIYKQTIKKLGIDQHPPPDRIGRFMRAGPADLARISLEVEICPTSDGEIIPTDKWLRHEDLKPLPEWCESVLIGSCKDEWSILQFVGGIEKYTHPVRALRHRLSSEFSDSEISELFSCFDITEEEESTDRTEAIRKIYVLIAEYGFRFPGYYFTRHWATSGRKAFLAHMYVGTPLPGVHKGRAHHGVEVALSFQNHNDELPKEGGYVELGKEMAIGWVRYAYGEDPWTPFGGEGDGRVKVFDVKGRECRQRELDERGWETWGVIERLGLDKGWEVARVFLEGPREGEKE